MLFVIIAIIVLWFLFSPSKKKQETNQPTDEVARQSAGIANAPKKHTCLVNWMLSEFQRETGVDLSSDAVAMSRINSAASRAVKELEHAASCAIDLPYIAVDSAGPKHLSLMLTKSEYDRLIAAGPVTAASTATASAVKYCPQCKKVYPPDKVYCESCGMLLQEQVRQAVGR